MVKRKKHADRLSQRKDVRAKLAKRKREREREAGEFGGALSGSFLYIQMYIYIYVRRSVCVCVCVSMSVCVRLFICLFCYIMFVSGAEAEKGVARGGKDGNGALSADSVAQDKSREIQKSDAANLLKKYLCRPACMCVSV